MVDGVQDMREAYASAIWRVISLRSKDVPRFEHYLAQVPAIPTYSLECVARFPCLVLVDPRFGIGDACKLVEVYFGGDEDSFKNRLGRPEEQCGPFWTRMEFASRQKPKFSDILLAPDELYATAVEGAFFLLEYPGYVSTELKAAGRRLIIGGSVWPGHPERPASSSTISTR